MAYRVVKQAMWMDEKVIDNYSAEDKYFWLYLLTNPQCNQLGVYKLPIRLASFQLGYSSEQVLVLIDRFEKNLKQIKYNRNTQEVAIGNYLFHSIISGGKPVFDTIMKDITTISDKSLFIFVLDKLAKKDITNLTIIKVIEVLKDRVTDDNDNDNDNGESCTDSVGVSQKQRNQAVIVDNEHQSQKDTAFDSFWSAYPKKVGKAYALKAWKKNHAAQHIDKALKTIERMKATDQWQREGGRFIPNPATWINQGRWDDEVAGRQDDLDDLF